MRTLNLLLVAMTLAALSFTPMAQGQTVKQYVNKVNPNASVRKAGKNNIIIVGTGDTVRAFAAFHGSSTTGTSYAEVANSCQAAFGSDVRVYCMPVPIACEFYLPNKGRSMCTSQCPTLNNIFSHLNKGVTGVDVYTTLGRHAAQPIYSRTDHHWSPLGAYYAAQEFARVAKVPFKDLKSYESHSVKNYVGSMYGFSKDAAVKNAPETFVYYTPKDAKYTTTRTIYKMKNKAIASESVESPSKFFIPFSGSSAYCTFMGGDRLETKVVTHVGNGRRLLIVKDSYGNAIPGFLFYSFEQIHVLDFRYFNKNLKTYVKENGITDVLIVNTLDMAVGQYLPKRYKTMLNK